MTLPFDHTHEYNKDVVFMVLPAQSYTWKDGLYIHDIEMGPCWEPLELWPLTLTILVSSTTGYLQGQPQNDSHTQVCK